MTKGHEDEQEFSLIIPDDRTVSVETGLGLYTKYEKNNIQASFSKMFHEEYSYSFANPLTQLMNELNQVTGFESDVEEVDWNGNVLEKTKEHVVLETILAFLEYCKSFTCFSSDECAIFENMARTKMLYPQFYVGY